MINGRMRLRQSKKRGRRGKIPARSKKMGIRRTKQIRTIYGKTFARRILDLLKAASRVTILKINWPMRQSKIVADVFRRMPSSPSSHYLAASQGNTSISGENYKILSYQIAPIFTGLANRLERDLGRTRWIALRHENSLVTFLTLDREHVAVANFGRASKSLNELKQIERLIKKENKIIDKSRSF